MFKRLKFILIVGIIGVLSVGCDKSKEISLRDILNKLQSSGATLLTSKDISIEIIGNKEGLEFAKEGAVLYDTDSDLIGDTYIGISNTEVYKNMKEDRYLISDTNGNNICVTLVSKGKEPKCSDGKVAQKMN